jgi:hypothetical protein
MYGCRYLAPFDYCDGSQTGDLHKMKAATILSRPINSGGLYIILATFVCCPVYADPSLDFSAATVVIRTGKLTDAESSVSTVLIEEFAKRTGITLSKSAKWPKSAPVIAIATSGTAKLAGHRLPKRTGSDLPEHRTDGYRLFVDATDPAAPIAWVIGADARGTLYGVGALLRNLDWAKGKIALPAALDIATSPMSSIRGHQLGFRAHASSYDAWTVEQYDQYIRELTFFGVNSIENIPFQDTRVSPVMKVSREDMNRGMSAICKKYGLDYWVWTPADFDLNDAAKRAEALTKHEKFYQDCVELSGIFFPGGDPGKNPAELVLPYLEDVSKVLHKYHPRAKLWLSLQGFEKEQVDYVFNYLETKKPTWLGGLCEGPSSPPIATLRQRLSRNYKLRMYPDITHNKLSQYEVPWWDQAYALVLGREAINPRPTQYAYIHNWFAPYCDGFISYSDGCHDDVNKTIWSALGWDRTMPVHDILTQYSNVFFGSAVADGAADGILSLEKNWRGPLIENGAVEGTLFSWQALEKQAPELESNWRWQMCLSRAYYDTHIRRRFIYERELEEQANGALLRAQSIGSQAAMAQAAEILDRATKQPVAADLRVRIEKLYDGLFNSIGIQSSSEKYFASDPQRGAVLDFIELPLNNRWWLEDEFKKVAEMKSEPEKIARLTAIAKWEDPGPGGFYDNVGNREKSTHVLHSDITYTQVAEGANPSPTFWWWDKGKNRRRLTWQVSMDWPKAMVYEGLDSSATYVVHTNGFGKTLLKMDGVRIQPAINGKEIGEIREFAVPKEAIADGKLELTFDRPADEASLNWRQQSRISEIWVVKQ